MGGAAECMPGVLSVVASNPPPLVVGFSVGDVVTMTFTKAVSLPSNVSSAIVFQPSIGVPVMTVQSGTCSSE